MRTTRQPLASVMVALAAGLLGGFASAQDATPGMMVQDLQQHLEEGVAHDWEAVTALFAKGASLYTKRATFLPIAGGAYLDTLADIRRYFERSGLARIDARSNKYETVGDGSIYDFGSFTAIFSGPSGDVEVQGEYVALTEDGGNGLVFRSLAMFPARQPITGVPENRVQAPVIERRAQGKDHGRPGLPIRKAGSARGEPAIPQYRSHPQWRPRCR